MKHIPNDSSWILNKKTLTFFFEVILHGSAAHLKDFVSERYSTLQLKWAFQQLRVANGSYELVSKFFPNGVAHVLGVETYRNWPNATAFDPIITFRERVKIHFFTLLWRKIHFFQKTQHFQAYLSSGGVGDIWWLKSGFRIFSQASTMCCMGRNVSQMTY